MKHDRAPPRSDASSSNPNMQEAPELKCNKGQLDKYPFVALNSITWSLPFNPSRESRTKESYV